VDFYTIKIKELKDGSLQVRPDWRVGRSKDLMTRGGSFYAIWDEEAGLWSTEIYDVQRLVDEDLHNFARERERDTGVAHTVATMESNSSRLWDEFHRFLKNSGNSSHNLDEELTFADTKVSKSDYVSRRLGYSLNNDVCPSWDSIVGTLYNEEERAKIEWAIGAVVSGESKRIQKFLVFYGPPGSGKSTILNIIQKLFDGYSSIFDARELGGSNNAFATSAFKNNPLVAIQHDGDLSRIVDNTKLNSIVAHESMTVNEKYKTPFEARLNAFLFMGTNVPVKISDAKSGIIRRLIDVVPTQQIIDHDTYHILMDRIDFELGAIAQKCLDRFKSMGKNYYSSYRPTEMMLQTDVFYNFVEAHYDIFKADDGISLKKAHALYKEFCSETGIDKVLPQYKMREELKNYFDEFHDRIRLDGTDMRSYYRGFRGLAHQIPVSALPIKTAGEYSISLEEQPSVFDTLFAFQPAQYANKAGTPAKKWENVKTTLDKLDTSKLHYVKVPTNHIVIDFDLTDEDGNKSLEMNLEAANIWPPTYSELSQSGKGIHLHYEYIGDVEELASIYDVGIEIKTLLGDSSLRRKLTWCNNINVGSLNGGLPKKEKKMLDDRSIKSEKGLRDLIIRNLRKEIHPGTKPSVDFIKKILDDAYDSDMSYDVEDMRPMILSFAAKSSNHSMECIKMVQVMKFVGKSNMPEISAKSDDPIVFYDVEVYPNLFIVCWKAQGDPTVVRMINPTSEEIEPLFKRKLVGFNNRRYDNHIMYARYLGYSLEELYNLSQRIINGGNDNRVLFGEAYNLSYTDIYDFLSDKKGLKKFEIELGILHMELDLPWDKPVPEGMWSKVEEYCVNDVIATEAVFEYRKADFTARQILAELSGLSVNHTTQAHTAKIIFGDDKNPQNSFVYTDLSEQFKGYQFDGKESTYRGEVSGEGGYVYSEPGYYTDVALLDVASMHPTSIEQLDLFGPYTERFADLKAARMAIKNKDYDTARSVLGGKLGKFVDSDDVGNQGLAYALKIVINTVYGLTSARFPNPFKDNRNKDNIVAKRGALFMIDLKHAVQQEGFTVAHIKTDSIKIPNATPEIIDFVIQFGKRYGYDFDHEATFERFCLINDAVYVAYYDGHWNAVGAQFQNSFVFKTLFSHEDLTLDDFCEAKNVVQGAMYLDFTGEEDADITAMRHVGRTGSFTPVLTGGGVLWRIKDGKRYHVTGTKGYLWIEREIAKNRESIGELDVNMEYFWALRDSAITAIEKFVPFITLLGA
jgi:energy-coupling factor transporter ATP-binding protein EcfA2